MLIKLPYREGIKVLDILTVGDKKYVVVEVTYEEITAEPIDSYIMRNSLVMYNGRYQSIQELVDYKKAMFLEDRDRGLVVKSLQW